MTANLGQIWGRERFRGGILGRDSTNGLKRLSLGASHSRSLTLVFEFVVAYHESRGGESCRGSTEASGLGGLLSSDSAVRWPGKGWEVLSGLRVIEVEDQGAKFVGCLSGLFRRFLKRRLIFAVKPAGGIDAGLY